MTAEMHGEQTAQPTGPTPGTRPTTIHRSRTDRMFAGVCGGIAENYGADPTAVRLLAVILAIFTGIVPMVILYLVAAVIIPEATDAGGSTVPATGSRLGASNAPLIIGVVLILGGAAALANQVLQVDWDVIWPMMLIGLGGLMVFLTLRPQQG